MMRVMMAGLVLAVAGCAVHEGRNPNYQANGNARFEEYRAARELALTTGKAPPRRVPVALPIEAPTGAEVAGPTLRDIVANSLKGAPARPVPQDGGGL